MSATMTGAFCVADERWHRREQRWAAPGEIFGPRRFSVDLITDDAAPRLFVCDLHYSGSYSAALFRVGLYGRGARLVGVAVFSIGMNHTATVQKYLNCAAEDGAELGSRIF